MVNCCLEAGGQGCVLKQRRKTKQEESGEGQIRRECVYASECQLAGVWPGECVLQSRRRDKRGVCKDKTVQELEIL